MTQRSHRHGTGRPTEVIIDDFVDAFDAMLRLRPDPDAFATRGRAVMASIVRPHVVAGRPIPIALPGFALKNPNRDKTFGHLPDRAEEAALQHLEAFCVRVAASHPAGCRITIVADSRVWSDLTGVDPIEAEAYGIELRRMASTLDHIELVGLDDLLDTPSAAALEAEFAEAVHRSISAALASPGARAGVARLQRLVTEDAMPASPRAVMVRHLSIGALTDARFPDHLRLSVHGRDSGGPKFGCRFGPTPPPPGVTPILPNHGVAVQAPDGTVEFMHLRDARTLPSITLRTTADGRPWCLERTPERTQP